MEIHETSRKYEKTLNEYKIVEGNRHVLQFGIKRQNCRIIKRLYQENCGLHPHVAGQFQWLNSANTATILWVLYTRKFSG